LPKTQFFDIRTLSVIVVILTGLDLLVTTLLVSPADFPSFSIPVLIFLLLLALIILILAFIIWKIILTEESKVETRYKNILFIAAILTLAAGFMSLLVYSTEIILSSGFLGTSYLDIDLTLNQAEIGTALMILTVLLKLLHNIFAIVSCLLTSIVWTRQFRIWARFSEASFVKSLHFVGMAWILLFIVQIITIVFQYFLYWIDPEGTKSSNEIQVIMMILLLIALLILPIYIYFLSMAGENIRIPHETEKPKSRRAIILPLGFFFLWFLVALVNVGGVEEPIIARLLTLFGTSFLVAVFIPISIGFIKHVRRVDSPFLRKNLFLAAVGTLALSTFSIVGPNRWTGMAVLIGYSLAFSVLTWSIANLSQFLGSREALLQRLRKAGDEFLSEIGKAEMKDQSLRQMARVMTDVSRGYMEDLSKIEVRMPPTEEEIRHYIVRTMGVEASPSESQVLAYMKDAIAMMKNDKINY
jgi:hypothetical protein